MSTHGLKSAIAFYRKVMRLAIQLNVLIFLFKNVLIFEKHDQRLFLIYLDRHVRVTYTILILR